MPTVFTPGQIDRIREITMEPYAEVATIAAALDEDIKLLILDDLDVWETVRLKNINLKPNAQKNLLIFAEEKRRLIRHNMRMRLGYPAVGEQELEILALSGEDSWEFGAIRMRDGRNREVGDEFAP